MPKNSLAKARALRIGLGSHKSDTLARYRNFITIAAVVACIGWLAASYMSPQKMASRFSPGPVSNAHAQLNCESCHDSSAPLRDATFLSRWRNRSEKSSELWHRPADQMCKACHPVIGDLNSVSDKQALVLANHEIEHTIPISPHTSNQKPGTVDSCASCHDEHLGTNHLPSIVKDSSCVTCHQDLEHSRKIASSNATDITSFKNHPEFSSLDVDSGTLKFNHQIHMSVGLMRDDAKSSAAKSNLDWENDPRLAGQFNPDGHITLNCSFCHEPTDASGKNLASASVVSGGRPLSTGRNMSMPSYELNCQVCHEIALPAKPELGFTRDLPIEHGADPRKLAGTLNAYFALEAIAPDEIKSAIPDTVDTTQEMPVRLWDISDPKTQVADEVRNHFNEAITQTRMNCVFCHLTTDDDTGRGIPLVRKNSEGLVVESNWFKKSRFDHSAHRDVNCIHCHENSGGKGALLANNQDYSLDRPMIKGLQSCLECHREGTVVAPARKGPINCTACHTYHGGGNRIFVSNGNEQLKDQN